MKKSELKAIIKEELLKEGTIAEEDKKAAKKIQPALEKALKELANAYKLIDKELSSANKPGLFVAFKDSIRVGGDRQYTKGVKFSLGEAINRLREYYK